MATFVGIAVGLGSSWARAQGAQHPTVWYRNDESCPDAQSFLALLRQRGVEARLAVAGDPVDFVVTLGKVGEGNAGTLERQTSSGSIAIRDVRDVRCEAVADALALSLALAHDPEAAAPPPPSTPPEPQATQAASTEAPPPIGSARPAPEAKDQGIRQVEPRAPGWQLALGASGHYLDLFDAGPIGALGVFVEIRAPHPSLPSGATARLEAYGGRRSGDSTDPKLWLASARLEGCPIAVKLGIVSLHPCVGLDVGALGASAGGVDDRGGWLSGAAHGRAAVELDALTFGVHAGAVMPFRSYEVAAPSSGTLDRSRLAAFAAGLSISFGPL